MKNLIFILLFLPILMKGQEIKITSGESFEEFALKNKPENSEKVSFLTGNEWNSKEGIFVFYEYEFVNKNIVSNDQIYSGLIGVLFLRTSNNNEFKKIFIDTIPQEGGDPKIEDLFFFNADNDQNDELILIISWDQKHYQISGKLYGTFIYDDLKNSNKEKLVFLKAISEKVDGDFDGNREGEILESKFKNREDIIAKLKELTN